MNDKNPSERIKNLITDMIFQDNYWGYLFSKISRREDTSLNSPMGVLPEINGTITIVYNSNFINLMEDDFLKIVIEHEGMHVLNNHIPRLLKIISDEVNEEIKYDKSLTWNLASDCAVNSLIPIKKKYYVGNQPFIIVHPSIYGLEEKNTAEYYYENLSKEKKDDKTKKENNKNSGQKTDSNSKSQMSCGSNIDDHSSWTKNVPNVSDISSLASRVKQYTDSICEESYHNTRKKGNLPGYIQEKINELLKPPQIPYYQMIAKLVKGSRLSKQKRAYTRINKKRIYTFFIDDTKLPVISPFPGKTKDFSFNISIVLDTSGSMSKAQILEGLSGVKNIIENDKDCSTIVIECDTIIHKEYEVKKLKDIDYTLHGRGGTTLFPAITRCRELNTDVTLVFTDGHCDDINSINRKLLPKKIIYVLTKKGSANKVNQTGYIVRLPK